MVVVKLVEDVLFIDIIDDYVYVLDCYIKKVKCEDYDLEVFVWCFKILILL